MTDDLPWYQLDPEDITLEAANLILQDASARTEFPNQWNSLLKCIQTKVEELKEQAKEYNPLAWVQPSYEQTLKLNVWIWGIDYIVDFDANRIGKTAGGVFNLLLWILPYDLTWLMFKSFTDHKGRTYQVLPRPPISAVTKIREFLASRPELSFDPRKQFDDPENIEAYNAVATFLNENKHNFTPNRRERTIWIGGPDSDWLTKEVMLPELKKWSPKAYVESISAYEKQIIYAFLDKKGKQHRVAVYLKSYDSEDTKWSGGAVDGIMLSEGVPQDIFNEVRQRYKYPAFGSWDYTPYEPRNTMGRSALAHKIYKDPSKLPLNPYVFSAFGIVDAPEYILSKEKRADLIKNWEGDPQGDARIRGVFYSSSPVVLKAYDPKIHALTMSFEELRKKWLPRPLVLFRGIDPGWGHVTACAWMALCPDNSRVIYRFYAESQRSIEERCEDIIRLSGNTRVRSHTPGMWVEKFTNANTAIRNTFIDYHTFKTDENTKQPFANNYVKNGLIVRPSVTFGPKERAVLFNSLLQPQAHLPHPQTKRPPGAKVYFLVNEPGVAEAVNKMTNLFWLTFEKGEKRGLTKDTVQDYDDDELDAASYVICPTFNYSSFFSSNLKSQNHDPSSTGTGSRLTYSTGIQFTS